MEPEKNKARKFKAKFMHCELELILNELTFHGIGSFAGMEISSRDTELRGTQTFAQSFWRFRLTSEALGITAVWTYNDN
jgi:hypothetical protein